MVGKKGEVKTVEFTLHIREMLRAYIRSMA
jgi:hypothetical protein